MVKRKQRISTKLTQATLYVYIFALVYAASIIIFDSGNLITREAVIDRWTILTALLGINTLAWYFSNSSRKLYRVGSFYLLIAVLIAFAGLNTYWERGMASTSTIFYLFPVIIASTLKNSRATFATAILSASVYAFSTVLYFNNFFNEGYRVQLWGSIALYVGTILVFGLFISKKDKKE